MTDAVVPQDRRTALAPDLCELPARAARAWTEPMAVRPDPEDGDRPVARYRVDAASGATYTVDPVAGTCPCPDSRFRGVTCKHRRRVAIEITAGRVPAPGERRVRCPVCGRTTDAPPDEPPLCGGCRFEPGETVTDRETGNRLVVERVRAARADEVAVPGADTTVADHPTNAGYPRADPVVEAVYPDGAGRSYRYPRSRLAGAGAAPTPPP